MKKTFIIAVLSVLFVTIAAAQNLNDTIYFDKDWNIIEDKNEAAFFRLYNAADKSDGLKPYQDYYINGTLQGEGYFVWCNGEMETEGEQKCYFENGKLKAHWGKRNGKFDGKSIHYYQNGNLECQAFYIDGVPEGEFKKYDSTGNLSDVYNYKKGILDGKQTQYLDGKVDLEDYFVDGVMQKEIRYSNGKIRRIFTLVSRQDTTFIANDTWFLREDEDSLIGKRSTDKIYNFDPSIWEYPFQMFYVDQADFYYEDGKYGYGAISEYHGKFQKFDRQDRIITDGQYSHNEKTGKWTKYLYDQNCYYTDDYDNDVVRHYYQLNNKPFSGIVTIPEPTDGKTELNIKNGIHCGPYTVYRYDNGELFMKYYGNFDENGKEDGYFHAEMQFDSEWKTVDFSNFKHGVKHGEWREMQGDSIIFKNYNNGELDGEFQIRITNSREELAKEKDSLWHVVTSGTFKNGKRTGHWWIVLDRHFEQKAKEGDYVDGKAEGEWIFYTPYSSDGYVVESQIGTILNYHDGQINGKFTRFKNKSNAPFKDSVDVIMFFTNDEADGSFEQHDNDGRIITKGNYFYGDKTGAWIYTYYDEKCYKVVNYSAEASPNRFYTLTGKPFTGKHTETCEKDEDYGYDTVIFTIKKSYIQQVEFIDSETSTVIETVKFKDGLPIEE